MSTFNGNGLGWTFDVELDDATRVPAPPGLAFKSVRHDGHNFGRDIRFIGIWIGLEQIDGSKTVSTKNQFVDLNSASFKVSSNTLTPNNVKRPEISSAFDYLQNGNSGLDFSDYFQDGSGNYAVYGLAVRYDAPSLFADLHIDNCEWAGLTIDQSYLFSRYANDPPHEPTGALMAARFHPQISYQLSAAKFDRSKPYYRVTSIRFDYRFNLYLDTFLVDKTASGLYNANQTGLFADTDIGTARTIGRSLVTAVT